MLIAFVRLILFCVFSIWRGFDQIKYCRTWIFRHSQRDYIPFEFLRTEVAKVVQNLSEEPSEGRKKCEFFVPLRINFLFFFLGPITITRGSFQGMCNLPEDQKTFLAVLAANFRRSLLQVSGGGYNSFLGDDCRSLWKPWQISGGKRKITEFRKRSPWLASTDYRCVCDRSSRLGAMDPRISRYRSPWGEMGYSQEDRRWWDSEGSLQSKSWISQQ